MKSLLSSPFSALRLKLQQAKKRRFFEVSSFFSFSPLQRSLPTDGKEKILQIFFFLLFLSLCAIALKARMGEISLNFLEISPICLLLISHRLPSEEVLPEELLSLLPLLPGRPPRGPLWLLSELPESSELPMSGGVMPPCPPNFNAFSVRNLISSGVCSSLTASISSSERGVE